MTSALARRLQTTRPIGPPNADPLVKTLHHDVYPAISPTGDLANSAKGMSILITGATGGIGNAAALAFALAGAEKIVLTSRTQSTLNDIEKKIFKTVGKGNVNVITVAADITNKTDVERLFDEAGDIDGEYPDDLKCRYGSSAFPLVLINNAGTVEKILPIHESDPDEWWKVQEVVRFPPMPLVNIKGTYLPTREFLKRNLDRTQLTVINTSSFASMFTRPGHSSYQPTKSQINRFTEFIHFEYLEYNVRAFAYHPGAIWTALTDYGMPKHVATLMVDTPELAGGFLLWLVTQTETTDFLRGRYVASNWDINELIAMKEDIVKKGLLWTRVVGQEQKVELGPVAW
ncbi:hypothetical protein Clacol_000687 [Clathrus columnatus]|uniref:Ketoreductase (KR) domain-containing protein n=1 Tax=Clathrus columnatus TaxID=1419009 RepID=A0AAV4ZXK1_9AGAM|nr:hypothetical protein Clacol_000687 [Clathrus columnatus]